MKKFIKSSKGQWAHPGKNTMIPNADGRITMKGVGYPVLGIDDLGNPKVMQPGGEYQFPGNDVYEMPLTKEEALAYAKNGYVVEELPQAQDGGIYTVKSGDTFNAIAYANGISPEELAAANPGINANSLSINQVLTIPNATQVTEVAETPTNADNIYLRQAYAESSFRPKVIKGEIDSPVGALGLVQIMPSTVKEMKKLGLVSKDFDPLDPKQAVVGQAAYMNWIAERPYLNKGEDSVKQAKFLGAYNTGVGNIKSALTKAKAAGVDIYKTLDWVDSKYLPKETVNYINRITGKNDQFNLDFDKAVSDTTNKYILDLYNKKDGGPHDPPESNYIQSLRQVQKTLKKPKTLESGRKLVMGEPGFKEQQEVARKNNAAMLTKLFPSIAKAEKFVNKHLGSPQEKARALTEKHTPSGEDPSDPARHIMAGKLSADAIKNKTGNIPYVSEGLGWLGSNVLGMGHELGTIFNDDRDWAVKLREAAEDMRNNLTGANLSFDPRSNKDITQEVINNAYDGVYPDGYGEKHPFKDNLKWEDPYELNKEQDGGYIELTDKEASEYRAGGYVLEEMSTGGPGDGIKKFLSRNNVQTSLGFGKLPFHGSNYTPQFGLNTIIGKPKKGFLDLGLTAGGDKNGFSGGLGATYYGPFMGGNRNFQAKVDADAYYDQGTLGFSTTMGGNFLGGNRNIGNRRGDALRSGSVIVEGGPFLQVGVHNDLNQDAPTQLMPNLTGQSYIHTGTKKNNTKFDFAPGAGINLQWKPKKFNNITLSAHARAAADLVDSLRSGAAKGHSGSTIHNYIPNPDAPAYTNSDQYIQTGEPIVALEAEKEKFKPEYKFDFGAKVSYDIDYNGGRSKSEKKIKQLKKSDPVPVTLPKPKKESKPIEVKSSARHPRWLQQGGFVLDLDEAEALEYAKNGYIVEMQLGGSWNSGTPFPASNSVPKINMVGDAIANTKKIFNSELKKSKPVSTKMNPFVEKIFNNAINKKITQEEYFNAAPSPIDVTKPNQNFDFSVKDSVDSESTNTTSTYTEPVGSSPSRLLTKEENLELIKDEALGKSSYVKKEVTSNYLQNLNKFNKKEKLEAKQKLINDYKNSSKEEIISLQEELQAQGFNIGNSGADGKFGPNTKKALEKQLNNETFDSSSIDSYYKNYTPNNKQEVEKIQKDLVLKGFLPEFENNGASNIDGRFGPLTKRAFEVANKSKNPDAFFFTNVPKTLENKNCASGMCEILEQNDVMTEALGVKYRNAWDIKENMDKNKNSTQVYNIYDDPAFKNVKNKNQLKQTTRAVKSKNQTTADMYQQGDIVGIFWPSSTHHGEVLKSKTHNTHVGFISGFKDGVPQITHNVGGNVITESYDKMDGSTAWIQRPNDEMDLSKIKYKPEKIDLENTDILIDNFEKKIEKTLNSSEKTNLKNTLKRVHTDAMNLPKVLGSSVDPKWVEAATLGITGVETRGGTKGVAKDKGDKSYKNQAGYYYKGVKNEDISLGISKTKFSQLDSFSKSYFNIKSWQDLGDNNKVIDVTSYNLIKHYDTFKHYAETFPQLKLTEDDIRSMSILAHNRGDKKLLTLGRRSTKGGANYYKGSEEDIYMNEVIKLRNASRMGAKENDISATNWKYLPSVITDELPSIVTGATSETYVSKVKRYMNDVYGKESLGVQNEKVKNTSIWNDPYYKKTLSNKKTGGFVIDLDKDEVSNFLNKGYNLEEIRK